MQVTPRRPPAEGGQSTGSSAQIGHGGRQGAGTATGTIAVDADGISLLGGTGLATGTQIGHGGYVFGGSIENQAIDVASIGALVVSGGIGKNASAQIVMADAAAGLLFSGDIGVTAGMIDITGGAGQFAHAQIGNSGLFCQHQNGR